MFGHSTWLGTWLMLIIFFVDDKQKCCKTSLSVFDLNPEWLGLKVLVGTCSNGIHVASKEPIASGKPALLYSAMWSTVLWADDDVTTYCGSTGQYNKQIWGGNEDPLWDHSPAPNNCSVPVQHSIDKQRVCLVISSLHLLRVAFCFFIGGFLVFAIPGGGGKDACTPSWPWLHWPYSQHCNNHDDWHLHCHCCNCSPARIQQYTV